MKDFKGADILSTRDFSREDIEAVLQKAEGFLPIARKEKTSSLLEGKVLAALFYEPSTRTRLSFETAMLRLGGKVINVIGMDNSSVKKGETLYDTGKMVEGYADVIAMRHPEVGSVAELAEGANIPVLNGGDGTGEHPTQALLDVLTIKLECGKIDGLTIALVGDLKNGRTVHSLSYLLSHFNVKLILVSPEQLKMPESVKEFLRSNNVSFEETTSLEESLKKSDVVYMTRVQKERFADPQEYEKLKGYFILTRDLINRTNPKIIVLHPLPRVGEIGVDVDDLAGAAYFRQAQNGIAARMALLAMVLGF